MEEWEKRADKDSWLAWSNHVLLQLENDTKCLHEIKQELNKIRIEIAMLKVKSGLWGAAGAIPVAITIILLYFKFFKGGTP